MKCVLIFWEMHDSSMSLMSIIRQTSHHTIHKVYCQEYNSLYPILWVTTRYSCSKRCDTFCQNCTFLEVCIPRNTRDAYKTTDLQCSLQNSITWNYGEQMLEMHTSKHSQGRNFTLWVGLNLKNYKDMFLSCTKHFMVQDQEEHVGMINSLTYSITWVSNPQKQIQTYG